MEKSEFLKEILSLSREEIEKRIKKEDRQHKKIYPAVYLRRDKKKEGEKK